MLNMITDIQSCDALALAELVRSKEITPLELLEAAQKRANDLAHLGAIVGRFDEYADDRASAPLTDGPFMGVPFLLKDLSASLAGQIMSCGSKSMADYRPDYSTHLVQQYEKAGLIPFGRTHTPEFGLALTSDSALYGPCKNPWDESRTSGASSGGAAVAVATGIVPMAHASDGGGSIRCPASCCGVFGLKPSRGRVSMAPMRGEAWSGLAGSHVISRSVRDSAAALDISHGLVPGDPYACPLPSGSFLAATQREPKRLRIAFSDTSPAGFEVSHDAKLALTHTLKLLENLGHELIEDTPTYEYEQWLEAAFMTIIFANHQNEMEEIEHFILGRPITEEDVEPITYQFMVEGKKYSAADYARSINTLHAFSRSMAEFHETYDIFLTPTVAQPPLKLGIASLQEKTIDDFVSPLKHFCPWTRFANISGAPSMSVPLYWTKDNLPMGSLLTAAYGNEELLFSLAAQLEQAQPWQPKLAELW